MANKITGSSANQPTYSDYIDSIVSQLASQGKVEGKDYWVGTDDFGQKHYSAVSKDALQNYLNTYNAGNGAYRTKDGTDYTLIQNGTDKNGKPTYTTVNTSLYNIQQAYDNNAKNTRAEYAANDSLYQANLDLANKQTQANYDASAKQYYTQYMQNQRKLKEQASRMGLTCGASEMASLGVVNNYASNYANNEGGRNNALMQNQMDYNNRVAQNHENMANALANIYAQRASDESNFYNAAQQQAYTVANKEKDAQIDVDTYKQKLAADSAQEQADLKALEKNNSKVLKTIRNLVSKNPKKDYYVFINNGKLKYVTDPSIAALYGGIKFGSKMSIADIVELSKTEKEYQIRNKYSK